MRRRRLGFRTRVVSVLGLALGVSATLVLAGGAPSGPEATARKILAESGVRGGLIVHLGCGDGKLTTALRAGDSYVVHGLDTRPEAVQQARQHIRSLGGYGSVSVDRLDSNRLPYVDNLVNLLVSEDLGAVTLQEVLRVLAPGGVASIKEGKTWTKKVKPRPAEIDEWTHFLHDASNNAVAEDSVVGPPRQLQWVGGPEWARSHDHLASVSAVVSSGGRIFYIVDEGPTAAVVLEPEWHLVARDAFSGVILWKRRISEWQGHLRGFRSGPSDLSRRLVAVGERVYVTLGVDAPVSALDAASGSHVTTYEGTDGALEMVCDQGTLFVVVGDQAAQKAAAQAQRRGERPGFVKAHSQRPAFEEPPPLKRILAFEAASGRRLWQKAGAETSELMPTTLAVSGGRVFFQNPDEIICLGSRSGNEVWRAKRPLARSRPTWSAPTLVVYGDVVLSGDRAVTERREADGQQDSRAVRWMVSSAGGQAPIGELIAFSAKDGKQLWSCKCRECYNAPVDILVADGLVWTGNIVRARDPGVTEGRDPKTGEVKRTRPSDLKQFAPGMGHGRCYRNKATSQYLVFGRSGVEFIDLATGRAIPNHWTRGTCQYGVMPCNGLLYVPPHSCACFTTSKLSGFTCLAPKRSSQPAPEAEDRRLERGPAYGKMSSPSSTSPTAASDEWPTYRHDSARSGRTTSAVSAKLAPAWREDLGGKLSSLVVAEGKLFVAQVDSHTIHALAAEDGRRLWSYTTGGRVDSPPTIWQGGVLFGSADGWVYCLRAADGTLVWRFRAAPYEQRIVSYGQLESPWPLHGSVLVQDGVVCCAVGRSSYLDGGLRMVRLDAKTGRKLSETVIDHRDPETGFQRKGVVRGTNMPGALPDVLSSDGGSLFMRHTRFDLEGQMQAPDVPHLFSPAGFLDGSWWHRTYWLVGTIMGSNYGGWPRAGNQAPSGRLLVVDDERIYGFGRNQYIHHGAHVGIDGATVFHFNPSRDGERRFTRYRAFAIKRGGAPDVKQQAKGKKARRPRPPRKEYLWNARLTILARAMVQAGDKLFMAGPPDLFVTEDPAGALRGTRGGSLLVLATSDGRQLAEYALDSAPVYDGLAVSGGRLFLATTGGKVLCYGRAP